jgi:1,5-rhamnosyltransferase
MNKVCFFGWYEDYERLSIMSLKNVYNVEIFNLPKLLLKIHTNFPSVFLFLFNLFFCNNLSKKLSKFDHIIIGDNELYFDLLSRCKANKKIMIIRNVIKNTCFLNNANFSYFSFDESDSREYGLNYYNQFLNVPVDLLTKQGGGLGGYFLGLGKNRINEVMAIKNILKEKAIHSKIILIRKPQGVYEKILLRTQWCPVEMRRISYEENLYNVINSDFLIEVVNPGQTGITLRALESVMFNKKLITNNSAIVNYSFYDRENIRVVDFMCKKSLVELFESDFFDNNYKSIDASVINSFNGTFVLNEIIVNS